MNLGWSELMVIGIVALIVVGPKDLPVLFRRVGEFVGKARGMAREFSRAMEQAADEAGVKETASSLRKIADPKQLGLDKVKEATDSFKAWDPDSATGQLAEERAEAARKIHEATAKKASERIAAEKAAKEAEAAKPAAKETAKKTAAKKTPAKKAPAKAAATKAASAKPAAKKPAAKKATKTPGAKA